MLEYLGNEESHFVDFKLEAPDFEMFMDSENPVETDVINDKILFNALKDITNSQATYNILKLLFDNRIFQKVRKSILAFSIFVQILLNVLADSVNTLFARFCFM